MKIESLSPQISLPCLHHLLDQRKQSENIALSRPGDHITYAELISRANATAHQLSSLGVGSEVRVASLLEASFEQVILLLAIWKAGGVYVPLERHAPVERLAFQLSDSEALLVVGHEEDLERLPVQGPQAVSIEELVLEHSSEAPEVELTPRNLAYVIYTSGSTGRPKGVGIAHEQLMPLMLWSGSGYGFGPGRRTLQNLSPCFDYGLFEVLTTLIWGGTLYFTGGRAGDVGLLAELIEREGIDTLNTTPSIWRELAAVGADLSSLDLVALGGEALTADIARQVFERAAPTCRLLNGYGPTEASISTTLHVVERAELAANEPLPIGQVEAESRVWITAPDLTLTEAHEVGELVIGGPGLARGYQGRPALTAQAFVPNPFATEPGERLYRTGDRARWRAGDADVVEFLGRFDDQVKVRGFRIEPEEISFLVNKHPEVEIGLVTAPMINDERTLVGYVVPKRESMEFAALVSTLEEHLRARLPSYMVPQRWQQLDAFPLTVSGKIDRKALVLPVIKTQATDRSASEIERTLIRLFASLGMGGLNVDDDLMSAGAHSLVFAQLSTRLRQQLGVELSLPEIFNQPNIAALAKTVEEAPAPDLPTIEHLPLTGPLPQVGGELSFAQEQVWFIDQLSPDNLAYNVQFLVHFRGFLDIPALWAALSAIVERHEIFRTGFPAIDGEPRMVVYPPQDLQPPMVDLAALTEKDRSAEQRRACAELVALPFDLERPPLARWCLLRLSEEEHDLLQVEQHFVHDGWSISVLIGELKAFYAAFAERRAADLSPLPIQYRDFVRWQRRFRNSIAMDHKLRYWRRQLQGLPPVLDLPTDRPRPTTQSFQGDALLQILDQDLYAELRRFARQQGTTLFVLMSSVFAILLGRLSGRTDVPIGSGFANRRLREIENLIGMIVNAVVLRADLRKNPRFSELTDRFAQTVLEAQVNQDLPFEKLVEDLQPERQTSYNPLFQVMFGFHDSPVPELEFDGLIGELEPIHNRSAKTDLNLVVIPRAEQRREDESKPTSGTVLRVIWEFSTDLFDRPSMERMWSQYMLLLRQVIVDPEARLTDLSLLSEAETRQVRALADPPPLRAVETLWDRFHAWSMERADALALLWDAGEDQPSEHLSYGALARRSQALAGKLVERGVQPGDRVAILLERSPELICSVLAVIEAGAAYLPLDPKHPVERQSWILQDAEARLLISRRSLADALPDQTPRLLLGGLDLDSLPTIRIERRVRPEDLAYVIYTSGSTGHPKGTLVSHHNAARLFAATDQLFAFDEDDAWTFFHSIAFDFSVWEVWGALVHGARLVGFDAWTARSPRAFWRLLDRQRVSVLSQTPSAFLELQNAAQELGEQANAALQWVVFGGEALEPAALAPWLEAHPEGPRLVNMYGITETTVHVTFRALAPSDVMGPARSPIGGPLPDLGLAILDRWQQPVAEGGVGELAVSGSGLAMGYLRRPSLTAERFVPHPDASVPGERLYLSGDLVRRLPDGELDFVGRRDLQVKVRGHRLELGEIEAVLLDLPEVRQAAVLIDGEGAGLRLVAFLVLDRRVEASTESEWREHLKERLPDYMVPALLLVRAVLPRTVNGKIDRKRLAREVEQVKPDLRRAEEGDERPRTPTEELMTGIWTRILERESIGLEDSFFDLGGHSLLVTRVIAEIRKVFGLELPLRELFEAPTLTSLSARLEERGRSAAPAILKRSEDLSRLPLSFAQQRLWFLCRLAPDNPYYNLPFSWILRGELDVDALERTLNEIVRRHEALRTRFPARAGEPEQVIDPVTPLPLRCVDLSALDASAAKHEAGVLATAEILRPFDLAEDRLIRATLVRIGEREHSLLVTLHHIISDGWSVGVLLRELRAIYPELAQGRRSPLPDLALQYADFALWQRSWLTGSVLHEQLDFWRQTLDGAAQVELPTDRPRPTSPSFRGRSLTIDFSSELSHGLERLGVERRGTLFMTALAAFQALLWRLTGERDVVIGSGVANRRQGEIEGLIGFFVNTLVARSTVCSDSMNGDPTFLAWLDQVRENALQAYAHQDLPFEMLVEKLRPERDLARHPFFQLTFAVQNAALPDLKIGSLDLDRQPYEIQTTRFDLEVHLKERADGGLACVLIYAVDLFDRTTIERFARHYHHLLGALIADPTQRLSSYGLLSSAEQAQVVREWNDTALTLPDAQSVLDLIAERCEQAPDALALVDGDAGLSYGSLDQSSGRIANGLRRLGVGQGTIVALALQPGLDLIRGLLTVLRAGAAYVVLDPADPGSRTGSILADASPVLALVDGSIELPLRLPGWLVDDLDGSPAGSSLRCDAASIHGEQLAYVLYTSGSTGRPKGVAVAHRQLLASKVARREVYADPYERFLSLPSFAFDASAIGLYGSLISGGCLVLADAETRRDPGRIARTLEAERITHLLLPPPVHDLLLSVEGLQASALRSVIVGGQSCSMELATRHRAILPQATLHNEYGPTEGTIWATVHAFREDARERMGRPIPNARIWIVDPRLEALPVGGVGELLIGGAGVACGYQRSPAKTAERFVPDPFSNEPGARIYRTGDLARFWASGEVEFLGRCDRQIKIRGFRMEPGEIESVLLGHGAVRESCVLVREAEQGKELVAFISPDPGFEGDPQSLVHDGWEVVFDATFGSEDQGGDPTFNIVGWESTFTNQQFRPEEMRDWLSDTLAPMRELQPRRVLEIGCGMGLLLFPLSRLSDLYVGTDFSKQALRYVEETLGALGPDRRGRGEVRLEHRAADDFSGLEAESFEAVILNSVVQYFPNLDYLLSVLRGAVERVEEGGVIYLGDIRSLPLLEAYHAARELHQAEDDTTLEQLRWRFRQALLEEGELAIDPEFFTRLPELLPRLSQVEIFPKQTRLETELGTFRYQVLLHVGGDRPAPRKVRGRDGAALNRAELVDLLDQSEDVLALRHLPNRRLAEARRVAAMLSPGSSPQDQELDPSATVFELRQDLERASLVDAEHWNGGFDPTDLSNLAGEKGFKLRLDASSQGEDGSFHAIFSRGSRRILLESEPSSKRPLAALASRPARGRFVREASTELRSWLTQRLPEAMVPSRWVTVDALPRAGTGKVDSARLLTWAKLADREEPQRAERRGVFVAPRNALEEQLAELWSKLLGRRRISVEESFFDLGGHSLLATQVISQVRKICGVDLPLRALFEAPTLAGLARAVAAEQGTDSAKAQLDRPALLPRQEGELAPLSFAQQRLWFLNRLTPDSASYNVPITWILRGDLSVPALRASLTQIRQRHEVLRTTFPDRAENPGEPCQEISGSAGVDLPVVDLRAFPEADAWRLTRNLATEEALRPFDLAAGPLLRARLLRLETNTWALVLTLHHIISDGWSVGVLLRELQQLYPALKRGEGIDLQPLDVQYADFALWQRAWLSGEVLEIQLDYWQKQLRGAPPLELPLDHPRPTLQRFRGGRLYRRWPAELVGRLRVLAEGEQGTSFFMIVLAAFGALIERLSGQRDLTIGTPIAGRHQPEIEPLIGFFVNSLALRLEVDDQKPFVDLVDRVRDVALGAYAHQDLPFEMLVERLQPERDLTRNPLFQVSFALQNAPMPRLELADLSLEHLPYEVRTTRFDFEIHLFEEAESGEVICALGWDRDLLDESTVSRWQVHYRNLLEALVESPTAELALLPLLSAHERHQLQVEWGDRTDSRLESSVVERWRDQAEAFPERIALVERSGLQLSYGETLRQADQLAARLRVTAGTGFVGLLAERSSEQALGLLGILSAGAAYVPLDPAWPEQRLSVVLADSGLEQVLAVPEVSNALDGWRQQGGEVVPLLPAEEGASSTTFEAASPEQPIYVIYTSGSTGQPKGTVLTHRNVARLFSSSQDRFAFDANDTWSLFHSVAFDVSVWELWGALALGGRLYLVDHETTRSPELFWQQLQEERVSVLSQTPSAFRALSTQALNSDSQGHALRLVVFGGEAIDLESLRLWCDHFGDEQPHLVNMYGITETTVHVTWRWLDRALLAQSSSPIGRPLPDLAITLRDRLGRPVPIGVAGEIHVAGPGVAQGYLDRPRLTAERFIPDDQSREPGARLYRSGDLARFRTDGELDFLGRIDHQVKIRGFRIELGEISSALREHPNIADAVILAQDLGEETRDQRLVAYLVQDPEAQTSTLGTALGNEQVEQWRDVFDDVYRQPSDEEDATFNIVGWNSRFTGQPIPALEMRAWVDETLESIRELNPRRVLELGCGTGLLLLALAEECEQYTGTDLSPQALEVVREQLASRPELAERVELFERPADRFEGLEEAGGTEGFDTILLNSVVQYFPNAEYLLEVLVGAFEVLAPGGCLYLGDLRSLPLQEAFYTSLALARLETLGDDNLARLQHRAAMERLLDEELVIDPAFFHAVRERLGEVARISVRPKRWGSAHELTAFRYQVVLQKVEASEWVEPSRSEPKEVESWEVGTWSRDRLRDRLRRRLEGLSEPLALVGVGNARLASEVATLEAIRNDEDAPQSLIEFRRRIQDSEDAWEPSELIDFGEALGYQVELSWAEHGWDGRFDVLFRPASMRADALNWPPATQVAERSWHDLASDPKAGRASRRLLGEARAFLADRLPEYMIPAHYLLLESLPLTVNGKLDRAALPRAERLRVETEGPRALPRDEVEEVLSLIFSEVLGFDRIGVEDSFFHLGGHSLLATQVVAKVRRSLGVELPIRSLFEAPSVAALARRVRVERRAARPPILPWPRPMGWEPPLSFAQQRLWFLDRLTPDNPFYITPAAWRLSGALDIHALRCSLSEIVRRHEILRTSYPDIDGAPHQRVAEPAELPLRTVDLSGLDGTTREDLARSLTSAEAIRPFDLASGPVIRATLLRLAEEEAVLLLSMHHIVSDGWSWSVIMRELSQLYGAYVSGRPSPLDALEVQYADFAVWQRDWLSGEVLDEQLDYWRAQLADLPRLELPTDRPRSSMPSYRGRHRMMVFDRALLECLESLSRGAGATLFMTLLAAYKILLRRYTGGDDLALGTVIANRNHSEIEPLIGFFVNTLVMRAQLDGSEPFPELLARIKEMTLAAHAHQDLPFEKVVEEVQPERDLSRNPLFQLTFALQNAPNPTFEMAGLTWRSQPYDVRTTRFDLEAHVWERPEGLLSVFFYDVDLFDGTTVARLQRQYLALLEGLVKQPLAPINTFSGLDEAARHHLRCELSGAGRVLLPATTFSEMLATRVERCSERLAVIDGDRHLSYGALVVESRRLSQDLGTLGMGGSESVVGLAIGRSLELIIAMVAVLERGAAYLPLDPDYPDDRLRLMAEQADLLVVQPDLTERFCIPNSGLNGLPKKVPGTFGEGGKVPGTIKLWRNLVAMMSKTSNSGCGATKSKVPEPSALAYVMFTSGSTGRPKAVAVTQASLAWYTRTAIAQYGLSGADRVLQFASPSFDISVEEIFPPLAQGATLVLRDEFMVSTGREFFARCEEERLTALFLPTAFWHQLTEEGTPPASLRSICFGGERVIPERVLVWRERMGERVQLFNSYGPTETTVVATLDDFTLKSTPLTSIGRAIHEARVYVVSRTGELAPFGATGEMWIGGAGVSRGYLGQPASTAERFVPDPFSNERGSNEHGLNEHGLNEHGSRLYRTGDRVRFLADGRLEYLGRLDGQVKIRGFRVEPGEIENILTEHPSVRDVVVVAPEEAGRAKRLVAYVVAEADPAAFSRSLSKTANSTEASDGIDTWASVFDGTYAGQGNLPDPTFNTAGWESTYDGTPFPEADMRQWLADTLAPIVAAEPQRVLEIGCGTGLLLFPLAPQTQHYLGTDISQQGLDQIAEVLNGLNLPQVELQQAAAHQLELAPQSFDAVILNSVIQYFPDASYLLETLERAIAGTDDGGLVMVGDVRSLPLLAAYHAAVILNGGLDTEGLGLSTLAARFEEALPLESELLVDPAFFLALEDHLPRVRRVEILPKRVRAHNELSAFRYQVLLHVGSAPWPEPEPLDWQSWEGSQLDLDQLLRRLALEQPELLAISGIPNARTARMAAAARLLANSEQVHNSDPEMLHRLLAEHPGVDPWRLEEAAESLGYQLTFSWAGHGSEGRFDVILTRGGLFSERITASSPRRSRERDPVWRNWTSDPQRGRYARQVTPELRRFLAGRLPEPLVPSLFVPLSDLPNTPGGKIDRRALEQRPLAKPGVATLPSRALQSSEEKEIARIWSEILGLAVGVEDNFFNLGGHSLLATQVMSRLRQAFDLDLPLRTLFEKPTVSSLAEYVAALRWAARPPGDLADAAVREEDEEDFFL